MSAADFPLEICLRIALHSPESWYAMLAVPLFGLASAYFRADAYRAFFTETLGENSKTITHKGFETSFDDSPSYLYDGYFVTYQPIVCTKESCCNKDHAENEESEMVSDHMIEHLHLCCPFHLDVFDSWSLNEQAALDEKFCTVETIVSIRHWCKKGIYSRKNGPAISIKCECKEKEKTKKYEKTSWAKEGQIIRSTTNKSQEENFNQT